MNPRGIFVYGTLKSGECYAWVAERAGLLSRQPAWVEGLVLFDLPVGYPAAVPGPGRVRGEFLVFRDLGRALEQLDAFEGEPYRRIPIEVATKGGRVPAWVYVYPDEATARREGGRRLAAETWTGALSEEP